MKLFTRVLFFLLLCGSLQAQLPTGATAPNFRAKDINGKTWDLYEVLETGRAVVIDVSATWCGPCWNYHNSHALETFYEQHGPEGDGNGMVFFIEGDGDTNTECLYGPSGCNNSTMGNWVAGTPYPIIDNASIANQLDIGYFPTVYVICPDGYVNHVDQQPAASLWNTASGCIGDVKSNFATLNTLRGNSLSYQLCQPQEALPTVHLKNMGKVALTNAILELRWNDDVVETINWIGNLPVFEEELVTFSGMSVAGPGTLSVVVRQPNGDNTVAEKIASIEYEPAPEVIVNNKVAIHVFTDNAAVDTYWAILDDNQNIIAEGGNQAVGINGGGQYPDGSPADPSAYQNFKLNKDTIDMPATGCITVKVVDGQGNGFKSPGNFKLFNVGSSQPFYYHTEAFTTDVSRTFARLTVDTKTPQTVSDLNVFPNPVSDQLKVSFSMAQSGEVHLFVTDAFGRQLRADAPQAFGAGQQQLEVNTGDLPDGVYFLHLQSGGSSLVRKFTVAK